MPLISVPKILQEKLTEEGVKALLELLNQSEENTKDTIIMLSTEKYEKRLTETASEIKIDFEEKITNLKSDLEAKIAGVKSDLEAKIASTKSDLEEKIASTKSDLEEKIASVKSDLEEKIASVKSDLEAKIASVKSDLEAKIYGLEVKIANFKADIIKWMFIFWVGQLASIISLFFLFLKSK